MAGNVAAARRQAPWRASGRCDRDRQPRRNAVSAAARDRSAGTGAPPDVAWFRPLRLQRALAGAGLRPPRRRRLFRAALAGCLEGDIAPRRAAVRFRAFRKDARGRGPADQPVLRLGGRRKSVTRLSGPSGERLGYLLCREALVEYAPPRS